MLIILGQSLVGLLLCIPNVTNNSSNPELTKIRIRFLAANLGDDSAAAEAKTLYFAGQRYARIEEARSGGVHAIVVNEPNIWVVNISAKTGIHSKNPGPDLEVHNPILGPDGPEELFDFEYGQEIAFLQRIAKKSAEPKDIKGKSCNLWEAQVRNYRIQMQVDRSNHPVELAVYKDERVQFRVEYLEYITGLPFDAALFAPSPDFQISEAE